MQLFSFILDNYLKGRSTYAPLRRILDFLFSASITSFLFQKLYFKYHWLDITDYKGIIDFFINGNFFIPFILFLIVHFGTYFLAYGFFSLTTLHKSARWIKKVLRFRLKRKDISGIAKKVNKNPVVVLPWKLDATILLKYYNHIKKTVPAEQWEKAEISLKNQKLNIERNFVLVVKSIIAVTIYCFKTAPHFGIILYAIVILSLAGGLAFLWYSYLVLDIIPTLFRKIDSEVQQHLASELMATEENNS
jgi:hypothetical protein